MSLIIIFTIFYFVNIWAANGLKPVNSLWHGCSRSKKNSNLTANISSQGKAELWSLLCHFTKNNALRKQYTISLFKCILPFFNLPPLHSLFHPVPLCGCFKGKHLAKSLTTGCFNNIHLLPFFFHWTVSPLHSCLPSYSQKFIASLFAVSILD